MYVRYTIEVKHCTCPFTLLSGLEVQMQDPLADARVASKLVIPSEFQLSSAGGGNVFARVDHADGIGVFILNCSDATLHCKRAVFRQNNSDDLDKDEPPIVIKPRSHEFIPQKPSGNAVRVTGRDNAAFSIVYFRARLTP
jgi:hypothetical protein